MNLTEIRYILARTYDREIADDYIDWLLDLGLRPIGVDDVWLEASNYVIDHNPTLGIRSR